MAEPPAPAISRAVATGACSRTTASTRADPRWAWAPSWRMRAPTCRAMTMPNGMEIRITGRVVTLAMNQHCSMNSLNGHGRLNRRRIASRATAAMFPASRRSESNLPVTAVTTPAMPGCPRPS